METYENDQQPAINTVHTNTGPSVSEQSEATQQVSVNNVDESNEPLTPENNPGGQQKKVFHSSALYATRGLHSASGHLKQHNNHPGLNL